MRSRSLAFVIRNRKILVEKLCYDGRIFYSIPAAELKQVKRLSRLRCVNFTKNVV